MSLAQLEASAKDVPFEFSGSGLSGNVPPTPVNVVLHRGRVVPVPWYFQSSSRESWGVFDGPRLVGKPVAEATFTRYCTMVVLEIRIPCQSAVTALPKP